ncbi:DUF6431 domain-containing protein [Megasphaera cerevisiae]|uniref:DUF6431 domain-containing protein n=1 Tax=Megasphaera cerevisiae TaxID=39029 RepID=UPI0022856EBE|nr:DUF6431 domain-containing protein [Megasphaera cerevisiae]
MSLPQQNLSSQEEIQCPYCHGPASGNGWRKRHVIRQGEPCWYEVRRGICRARCRSNFTILLECMLPHKHYCAQDIEDSLATLENGAAVNGVSCGAEESTLRRWQKEFRSVLPILAAKLEALAQNWFERKIPLGIEVASPLLHLKHSLALLEEAPDGWTVLGRSFFQSRAHPLCLG